MPSRRLCIKCGELTPPGSSYCETHKRRRGGELTWDWTVIRNGYLSEHPRCELCGRKATTVDHILARAFGGTHERSNLRALCVGCAASKDRADQKEGMRRKRLKIGARGDTPRGDGGSS